MCTPACTPSCRAAHSIVGQLWVVVSYAVDGFAAAGIVLGSRLFAHARSPELRAEARRCGSTGGARCRSPAPCAKCALLSSARTAQTEGKQGVAVLCCCSACASLPAAMLWLAARPPGVARRHMYGLTSRVLLGGAAFGLAAGLAFLAARDRMVALFSADAEVGARRLGGVWGAGVSTQGLGLGSLGARGLRGSQCLCPAFGCAGGCGAAEGGLAGDGGSAAAQRAPLCCRRPHVRHPAVPLRQVRQPGERRARALPLIGPADTPHCLDAPMRRRDALGPPVSALCTAGALGSTKVPASATYPSAHSH